MRNAINELIEDERAKLSDDKCQLKKEANDINIDMVINDHSDIDEIVLMIRFAARLRKIRKGN